MENSELKSLLERIAIALERIACSLEQSRSPNRERNLGNTIEVKQEILPDENIDLRDSIFIDNVIETFLNSRNIKIKIAPPEDPADDVINSLAEFLGNHYNALSDLLAKIKSNMQRGGTITFAIKDYSQRDISDICKFCTRLHEIAFLEQYKYFRSPEYLIKAKTTTLPAAQNFFSGKWLERFVLQAVQKAVAVISNDIGRKLDFSYLINPQIILPNNDDFELDLIFHVDRSFFWVEAKTGDYQQHISKYSKMAKIIGLDYKHSIMVLPDIQPERSTALTSLFSMTVYGLSQLEAGLTETIRKDVNVQYLHKGQ